MNKSCIYIDICIYIYILIGEIFPQKFIMVGFKRTAQLLKR